MWERMKVSFVRPWDRGRESCCARNYVIENDCFAFPFSSSPAPVFCGRACQVFEKQTEEKNIPATKGKTRSGSAQVSLSLFPPCMAHIGDKGVNRGGGLLRRIFSRMDMEKKRLSTAAHFLSVYASRVRVGRVY